MSIFKILFRMTTRVERYMQNFQNRFYKNFSQKQVIKSKRLFYWLRDVALAWYDLVSGMFTNANKKQLKGTTPAFHSRDVKRFCYVDVLFSCKE